MSKDPCGETTHFYFRNTRRDWKPGDEPGRAEVVIGIQGRFGDQWHEKNVTCRLINDGEIDYEIDVLIKELEVIRKKAKASLLKKNRQTDADLANRLLEQS